MQKNYRDFTVGELLDLGFNVDVRKHHIESLDDAVGITRMFEGTKQSTNNRSKYTTANAWKTGFHVTVFVYE